MAAIRLTVCVFLFLNLVTEVILKKSWTESEVKQYLEDLSKQNIQNCLNSAEYNYSVPASFYDMDLDEYLLNREVELLTIRQNIDLPSYEQKVNPTRDAMLKILSNVPICKYRPEGQRSDECVKLDRHLSLGHILDTTTNYDELQYYWKTYHDSTKDIKNVYQQFLPIFDTLSNDQKLVARYGLTNLDMQLEHIFQKAGEVVEQTTNLYKQLHAYARRSLVNFYGNDKIKNDGPIPAHLAADIFPSKWYMDSYFLKNFVKNDAMDFTPNLKRNNFTIRSMVDLSEAFYHSLGINNLPENFWNKSTFEETTGNDLCIHTFTPDCLDIYSSVKVCGPVNEFNFHFINIMLGEIHQAAASRHLHVVPELRWTEGIESGIAAVIDLYISSPQYLRQSGLLKEQEDDSDLEIKFLLKTALRYLPVLRFAYLYQKWMNEVTSGNISTDQWNTKWWEMRLRYQGLCPPVKRTEDDFDPAALFYFPAMKGTMQHFLAAVIQFQFYKALCDVDGYEGPLHRCNIFGSKEAGEKLLEVMNVGGGVRWMFTLAALTEGVTFDLEVEPLLEFFQPLYEWLVEKNKNESIGWNSDDATVCP